MRIIGGYLKGKAIIPPTNLKARPTTDFAKEGLFNILSNRYRFEECRVLDLFSGTGSISYEFISHGCPEVFSVEMNPVHTAFIKNTAAKMNIKGLQVIRHNVFDFLDICRLRFDIVFADPPYAIAGLDTIPDKFFSRIIEENGGSSCNNSSSSISSSISSSSGNSGSSNAGILKEGGTFILEHPSSFSFENHPRFVREKKYGNVHFSFFS